MDSRNHLKITWFHRAGNWAFHVCFRLFLRLRVVGGENIVHQGPLIVATNHTIFLDSPLAISLVRDDVFPMAKIEIFSGPFGWVFSNYGAFPVRRGEADLGAFRMALRALERQHAIYIAPEGTRTKEGALQIGHPGVALIAWRSGAPIQPVAIVGARDFWNCLSRLRRPPVEFRIGEPFQIRPMDRKPNREDLRQMTDEIMYRIAEMLPPAARGEYADLERASSRYLTPYGPTARTQMNRKEVKTAEL